MRVLVDGETVEDRHLFGKRVLYLKDLQMVRIYRDRRLWLVFASNDKPVWLVRGMGDLRRVSDEILMRAKERGATPKVITVEE
jgi:hypothetical protein